MPSVDNIIESEQRYRASAYALLAALLRAPPEASGAGRAPQARVTAEVVV